MVSRPKNRTRIERRVLQGLRNPKIVLDGVRRALDPPDGGGRQGSFGRYWQGFSQSIAQDAGGDRFAPRR